MRSAWSMAWNEIKHKPVALFMNFVVSALFGLVFGLVLLGRIYFQADIDEMYLFFFVDILLIVLLPLLGSLYMSKEYFAFHTMVSNEPFVKRLQFYCMWAIPLKTIAWSRMFYMLISLIASLIGFLSGFIVITWHSYLPIWGVGNYLVFIVVLICFTVALGGINPYLEFAAKGNKILVGQTLYMILALLLALVSNELTDRPVHLWIIELAGRNPWLVVSVAIIAAIGGFLWFQKLLLSGLQRKEFM